MKPVQPIYLRGGVGAECSSAVIIYTPVCAFQSVFDLQRQIYRHFFCGFTPKYFSMTRHRQFLRVDQTVQSILRNIVPLGGSDGDGFSATVAVS